jgi:hypothetical protein
MTDLIKIAILGPEGSGKTTFFENVSTTDSPKVGYVLLPTGDPMFAEVWDNLPNPFNHGDIHLDGIIFLFDLNFTNEDIHSWISKARGIPYLVCINKKDSAVSRTDVSCLYISTRSSSDCSGALISLVQKIKPNLEITSEIKSDPLDKLKVAIKNYIEHRRSEDTTLEMISLEISKIVMKLE